jgi:hypothetical protein
VSHASEFGWGVTAARVLDVYAEAVVEHATVARLAAAQ